MTFKHLLLKEKYFSSGSCHAPGAGAECAPFCFGALPGRPRFATMSANAATRFQRIYRAVLIPTLILCFAATIVFAAGCAALDENAVARTDRLPTGTFYKRYREPAGAPEPAL